MAGEVTVSAGYQAGSGMNGGLRRMNPEREKKYSDVTFPTVASPPRHISYKPQTDKQEDTHTHTPPHSYPTTHTHTHHYTRTLPQSHPTTLTPHHHSHPFRHIHTHTPLPSHTTTLPYHPTRTLPQSHTHTPPQHTYTQTTILFAVSDPPCTVLSSW